MGYGSFFRDDFTPGISDIDATMIIPADVVTNKELTRHIGIVVAEALANTHVPFQLSPTDTTTIRDGRFHTYTQDFLDCFDQQGVILIPPDYRTQMVCLPEKSGPMHTVSHNLRQVRKALLFAIHYDRVDAEAFVGKFESTLKGVSSSARQILLLTQGTLPGDRFSLLDTLPPLFPNVDFTALQRMKHLYTHLDELDALYRRPNKILSMWEESVTFLEQLARAYIRKHPKTETLVLRTRSAAPATPSSLDGKIA